jgi:hypothetical protein
MMNHPVIMQANAKERYDAALEAAELHRRAKRLGHSEIGTRAERPHSITAALSALLDRLDLRHRTDTGLAAVND